MATEHRAPPETLVEDVPAAPAGYEIRPLRTEEDFRHCVDLQEEVWGTGFTERVGVALLKVSVRLGGIAAGAWDAGGRLTGFVFGVTGIEDGRAVHWSDMLAVRTGVRDGGLGFALKAYQRRELLRRGITTCYWTFDPLESRNAYLNLGKLGATVGEYVVNMYGESDSPLHRGIGTDRFVALWALDSPRVEARLSGADRPPPPGVCHDLPVAIDVEDEEGLPSPLETHELAGASRLLVPIPTDIQAVKARDPALALVWRLVVREVLAARLAEGFRVVELLRGGALSHYLVERPR